MKIKVTLPTGKEKDNEKDEFIIYGETINESWQNAWPRAISRAWRIEYRLLSEKFFESDKELNEFLDKWILITKDFDSKDIDNNKLQDLLNSCKNQCPPANLKNDFLWYLRLLSQNSCWVLKALMIEGFIIDAVEYPPPNMVEMNVSTRLIVKKPKMSYQINAADSCYGYKYNDTISSGTSVEFTFEKDVNKPKGCPITGGKININEFDACRRNGWDDRAKHLEHVLVLSLPPRPVNADEYGIAVKEYEAEGRVYPFTCT